MTRERESQSKPVPGAALGLHDSEQQARHRLVQPQGQPQVGKVPTSGDSKVENLGPQNNKAATLSRTHTRCLSL